MARAIVDRARGADVRLVCLATHDRSPVVQLLGGAAGGSVVRSSPVPVLIAGPAVQGAGESVRRVVACVDGSGLAEQTLPVASGLARRLGAELVLVQVVPSRGPAQGGRAERAYLRRLADRLPYPARSEVIHGDPPATAIARYADQAEGTLLIMGTHGRGGLRNAVLGSVARDSPCRRMPGPRRAGRARWSSCDVRPAAPDRLPARPDGRSGSSAHDEILDVLIIERRGRRRRRDPGARGGGHRTTRCFDEANAVGFPCRAVVDPADTPARPAGRRPGGAPAHRRASPPLEQGASCALRAGIPVVESGGPSCWTPTGPG